jgi:hypothetical protein
VDGGLDTKRSCEDEWPVDKVAEGRLEATVESPRDLTAVAELVHDDGIKVYGPDEGREEAPLEAANVPRGELVRAGHEERNIGVGVDAAVMPDEELVRVVMGLDVELARCGESTPADLEGPRVPAGS